MIDDHFFRNGWPFLYTFFFYVIRIHADHMGHGSTPGQIQLKWMTTDHAENIHLDRPRRLLIVLERVLDSHLFLCIRKIKQQNKTASKQNENKIKNRQNLPTYWGQAKNTHRTASRRNMDNNSLVTMVRAGHFAVLAHGRREMRVMWRWMWYIETHTRVNVGVAAYLKFKDTPTTTKTAHVLECRSRIGDRLVSYTILIHVLFIYSRSRAHNQRNETNNNSTKIASFSYLTCNVRVRAAAAASTYIMHSSCILNNKRTSKQQQIKIVTVKSLTV